MPPDASVLTDIQGRRVRPDGSALKVAIVGTAPTSRDQAPYDDPSWEIWSQAQPDLPRWSRWFELHDPEMIEHDFQELWRFLAGSDGARPIYMREQNARVRGSLAYPRDAIIQAFGGPYFLTSTVAWEMALAISEGATEIALYGIEMAADTEWAAQKPGCQHFITLARRQGITVTVPVGCELLNPQPLYALGAGEWRRANLVSKRAMIQGERDKVMMEIEERKKRLFNLDGALEALDFFEQNWL